MQLLKNVGVQDLVWQLLLWLFYSKEHWRPGHDSGHYEKPLPQLLANLLEEQRALHLQTLLKTFPQNLAENSHCNFK